MLVSFDRRRTQRRHRFDQGCSAYHQMPGFGHDPGDLRDFGILLLPAGSVPAGTPAVQLPRAGYFDRLKGGRPAEVPDRRPRRLRRHPDLGPGRAHPVRLRRRPPLRHIDHHRASGRRTCTTTRIGTASAPAPDSASATRARPCSIAARCRPLGHERRQRPVQCEQRELSGRHAIGASVPRPVPGAPLNRARPESAPADSVIAPTGARQLVLHLSLVDALHGRSRSRSGRSARR